MMKELISKLEFRIESKTDELNWCKRSKRNELKNLERRGTFTEEFIRTHEESWNKSINGVQNELSAMKIALKNLNLAISVAQELTK